MNLEMVSERQALAEVLEQQVKELARLVRAFPRERFHVRHDACGRTPRDLAAALALQLRHMEELAAGRPAWHVPGELRTPGGIVSEMVSVHFELAATLRDMAPFRWHEVVPAGATVARVRQARRGELLWLELRELVRMGRQLGRQLGTPPGADILPDEPESAAAGR